LNQIVKANMRVLPSLWAQYDRVVVAGLAALHLRPAASMAASVAQKHHLSAQQVRAAPSKVRQQLRSLHIVRCTTDTAHNTNTSAYLALTRPGKAPIQLLLLLCSPDHVQLPAV
jgi:hypothetical protein